MADKRFTHIDFLRAVAIVGMIATHVLSYNLGTNVINIIWNYLHFVVPLFVFCSGYVMYRQYETITWNPATLTNWYKRRAVRLILPYYAFTTLHYFLWFLLPGIVSGLGLSRSPQFMLSSIFLVGVDYGWLPILFLELMFITPFILSIRKSRGLSIAVMIAAAASTVFFVFVRPDVDFRLTMWLPWSAILLVSFAAARVDAQRETKPILYLAIAGTAFAVFAYGYWFLSSLHFPLTLTLHKYPPDIFYLSYGIGMGSLLILRERFGIFHAEPVRAVIRWISSRSYGLFFVHYIVIDIIQTYERVHANTFPVWWQLILSLFGSIALIRLYEEGQKKWFTGRHSGK